MLKALAGDKVILGLSRMNVDRLVAGKPICFDGAEIDLPGKEFWIIFGETELAMAQELGVPSVGTDGSTAGGKPS